MPPKTLLRLGLGFLLLALVVYASSDRWLKTRIFAPLNLPVNLDTHQVKSPPFSINLREIYFVALRLDYSADDSYTDGRCNDRVLLGSQWRLYRLRDQPGQPLQLWTSSGEMTDQVNASPGRYELEWDLPAGAACLNARHPRLAIYTGAEDYREAVDACQIGCLLVFGTGFVLIALALHRSTRHGLLSDGVPRIFPGMALRNVLPIAKHKPLVLIQGMPHFGLFFGAVLWILLFIFMILRPYPSQGLLLQWKTPGTIFEKSPWSEAILVYVAPPARYFINGTEVTRSELPTKLLEEIRRQGQWTVYFEADPDTAFGDDAYALETIQACGATVVWVTPKMRQQFQRKNEPTGRAQWAQPVVTSTNRNYNSPRRTRLHQRMRS